MKSLEISARTVEDAIQQALEQLGVSREEVEVSVVKEGKSGILGLGSDEATVRVTVKSDISNGESSPAEAARDTLERLLELMDVNGSIAVQDEPLLPLNQTTAEEEAESTPAITLNINGEDLGILIGRRGQTLSCLQYIARLIVGHQM